MSSRDDQFSRADLLAAGVQLRAAEAVTIVRELILQVSRGEIAGIPSVHVVRLSSAGAVSIEGPVGAGDREVSRAAYLLEALLPGFDATGDLRVPGALRLVVARALGTLDLPRYHSLEEFAEALERFAADDAAATIRSLVSRCAAALDARRNMSPAEQPPAPESASGAASEPELTVSDIRRARRATGLTLSDISRRSQIAVPLLRQMEWGYLVNWPEGPSGRTHLIKYARAAGLDDQLVVRAVWPLVEEFARGGVEADSEPEPAPAAAETLADISLVPFVPPEEPAEVAEVVALPKRRRLRLAAALAIPALLALGVLPAFLDRLTAPPPAPPSEARLEVQSAPPHPSSTPAASASDDLTAGRMPQPAVSRPPGTLSSQGAPDVFSPEFTSEGSAIFYRARLEAGVVDADTAVRGAVLRITRVADDRGHNFHARPSPDGTQIAFDSDRDGERGIYLADMNGRNVRRVSGAGFAAIPSWSPDGHTLAYARSEPDQPRVWNLWAIDLASGQTRRLTSLGSGQPWGCSWFPDGRRIVYGHEDRLVVLDTQTANERVYRTPLKGRLVRTPAVSPDGGRIVFQISGDGTWMLDMPDGGMRKIMSDPSASDYSWSPDGRQVAYHSQRTGGWGIWILGAR